MNQVSNHDPSPNPPVSSGPAANPDLLDRALPSLPWSVETRAFDLTRDERIIVDISRSGSQITTMRLYGIDSVGERKDDFKVDVKDVALSDQINSLSGNQVPFVALVKILEEAQSRDSSLCQIEPVRSLSAIREEARIAALQNGEHISSVQQARSLTEILEGVRRKLVVMAKEIYSGDVLTLSIESSMTTRGRLEVLTTVHRRDETILNIGRLASAERAQDLTDAVASLRQTFQVSNAFSFIEHCRNSLGLILPLDLNACEPRFVYGRHLRDRLIEIDPACTVSSRELTAAREAHFEMLAFSITGSESPCRMVSLMVNDAACRGVTLTFESGAQMLIRSSRGDLVRGDSAALDGFIEHILGSIAENPFVVLPGGIVTYSIKEHDNSRVTFTDKASISINCTAYHLWSRHHKIEGLFPADFQQAFHRADLAQATNPIQLLRDEQFSLMLSLDASGIREVQVFERRSPIGRVLLRNEFAPRGIFPFRPQDNIVQAEEQFINLVQQTRNLNMSGLGWKGSGPLLEFLRAH